MQLKRVVDESAKKCSSRQNRIKTWGKWDRVRGLRKQTDRQRWCTYFCRQLTSLSLLSNSVIDMLITGCLELTSKNRHFRSSVTALVGHISSV